MSILVRPIVYKIIARLLIGTVLALLWDRFLNVNKLFTVVGNAFFVIGIVFLALAWVNYLKSDGLKFHFMNENREKKKKHKFRFMITDFLGNEPSPIDSLDEKDENKANLIANILTGLCFLLPSVVFLLFF